VDLFTYTPPKKCHKKYTLILRLAGNMSEYYVDLKLHRLSRV